MDLELFSSESPGRLVPIHGMSRAGVEWSHFAFEPDPLPVEEPVLTPGVYRAVARARAAIAALDATAQQLPNPQLFRSVSMRLEAQSTAALEGTYEPVERVLQADPRRQQPGNLHEVLNYLEAADLAFGWIGEGRHLTVPGVTELQRILMKGTDNERADSGRVRTTQVVIGTRAGFPRTQPPVKWARFVPPPPGDHLEACLRDQLTWANEYDDKAFDPVIAAAIAHYGFEVLHPFHDGNGRIGRLLVVVNLLKWRTLTEPSISVSSWFEGNRSAYYDALLGVSTRGDWSTWVSLFAEGLAASADDAQARMLELTGVLDDLEDRLSRSTLRTPNAHSVLKLAIATPYFTVQDAEEWLGLREQGSRRLLEQMVKANLLASMTSADDGRRKIYGNPAVWDVLLG